MFKAVVMQVFKDGVTVCDLCILREFFVETNNASKFSPGDKVYVQYSGTVGKDHISDQIAEDIFKVDNW